MLLDIENVTANGGGERGVVLTSKQRLTAIEKHNLYEITLLNFNRSFVFHLTVGYLGTAILADTI